MELISEYNLEDIGSVMSCGKHPQYTHYERDYHARLGRIYASVELVSCCSICEVTAVQFSDHSLVTATFGAKEKRNRLKSNLSKFNESLLEDEDFVNSIAEYIGKLLATLLNSSITQWEEFKEKLKIKAIERSGVKEHEQGKRKRT